MPDPKWGWSVDENVTSEFVIKDSVDEEIKIMRREQEEGTPTLEGTTSSCNEDIVSFA